MTAVTRKVTICNARGLHARASAKLVKAAAGFDAEITVGRDGQTVDARSIMGLLMLGASRGTQIDVATTGNEAARLADALEALVANRFGEDR